MSAVPYVQVSHSQVDCNNAYECVNDTINSTAEINIAGYRSVASPNSKILLTGSGEQTVISGAFGAYKTSKIISPDVLSLGELGAAYIVNDPCGIISETDIDCRGALSCAGSSIYVEDGNLNCRTGESCARAVLTASSIEGRGSYALVDSVIRPAENSILIKFYGHLAGYNTTVICEDKDDDCTLECYGNSCFNTKLICHESASCDTQCDDDISRFCPVVYYIHSNDTWTENGVW